MKTYSIICKKSTENKNQKFLKPEKKNNDNIDFFSV